MAKPASANITTGQQYTPEFRDESQRYAWYSKLKNAKGREIPREAPDLS